MNVPLAVVPGFQQALRPDIAWIKKNVSVLEVGKALGLRIRQRRARAQAGRFELDDSGDRVQFTQTSEQSQRASGPLIALV